MSMAAIESAITMSVIGRLRMSMATPKIEKK